MKTKNELEQAIVMHEEALESSRMSVLADTQDLESAKKELASFNKPELTGAQLDDISEAVENAVGNFDFDDESNYDKEFELDYDGKVQLSHLDFTNTQELIEMIVEKVQSLFVETEDKDDNSQVNNATHVERVI
tara:strand:+ start:149 stop:550 length:402 start_codon:yes stop_codon:yes gene_type:complete